MIKRAGYGEFNAQGAHLWLTGYQISKKRIIYAAYLRLCGTVRANKICTLNNAQLSQDQRVVRGSRLPTVFVNFVYL